MISLAVFKNSGRQSRGHQPTCHTGHTFARAARPTERRPRLNANLFEKATGELAPILECATSNGIMVMILKGRARHQSQPERRLRLRLHADERVQPRPVVNTTSRAWPSSTRICGLRPFYTKIGLKSDAPRRAKALMPRQQSQDRPYLSKTQPHSQGQR